MNPVKKSIFKLFTLSVLLGALWVVSSDAIVNADNNCFGGYDTCMTQCENNPTWTDQQRITCRGNCLLSYGVCTNEAVFNKEGQIIEYFSGDQAMPIIADFRMCLDNCPTCLLMDFIDDPEGLQACIEEKLGCKIACIEQF